MKLPQSHLRLADLPNRRPSPFSLTPTAEERRAIADALGIEGIKKLRFEGELSPLGQKDWGLQATLGATVVQACVVTLGPVTTRIDEDVSRTYLAEMPQVEGTEVEMPEDDTVEQLPETLDLAAVMIEALSLALPPYPRADGAMLEQTVFADPDVSPMTDDDAKPFAGLGALRDSLEKKDK
ncbi:YceD family protein [Yoonia sediminilitoris]|uniref:YceD family protein n=1 Tax=Yoonia sediminilitoris TaxID=1286148 RepID=UPI0035C96BCD